MATDSIPPQPPPPASSPSRVSPETVKKAVNALLKWNNAKSKSQKPQLLSQDDYIYLILTLKKIPPKGRTNPYKIPLPHPLHSLDSQLCLIVDDRPKSKLTKDAVKKKIQSENISVVSKVLKLSKLKSDYRPFEAKRKLCDSYDMFLSDKRVIPLLPKLLGKHFYKKRKMPVPVDLSHKNWKEQIERACGSALLYLRTGTCSVMRVGKDSMDRDEIVENVAAAIGGVVEIVPKKWAGVRSFHLKFAESLALPVYQALPDVRLKIEGVKEKEEEVVKEEAGKEVVKEETKGSVGKKDEKLGNKKGSKKGRIHEVRYMDSNVDDLMDANEFGSDDDEDIGDLGGAEFEGKKRKKGDLMKGQVLSELNSKKRSKKLAKVEKGDSVKQKKDGLSVKGQEESGGRKEKKSGLGKLKSGEMKVKDKKKKKKQAAE
ncbi:hypothetical protein L1049_002320 [Liquidambar formosana]|uniref:Ribosomal protein L1 n=1 Tax=Liquidambar formosana TaxID=63359 RepID=A0AAP0NFF8_LIQFO